MAKAASVKDPLSLNSFEDRSAAVEGKLIRLQNDPRYQKLSPADKVRARAGIYKKYVLPTFQAAGLSAPDYKVWLRGTKEAGIKQLNPGDQYRNKTGDVVDRAIAGAIGAAQGITLFGAKLSREFLKASIGTQVYFNSPTHDAAEINRIATERANASFVGKAVRNTQEALNQTNFWLQTHPRQSKLASAANWTGEQIVQLPLYEALGSVKLGEGVMSKMTPRLVQTKAGRFVARRLGDAFAGFAGNMIGSGGNATTGENLGAAAGFATFGAAMEPAAKWLSRAAKVGEKPTQKLLSDESKVLEGEYLDASDVTAASDSAIKKWSANHYAMGGEPFAEDIVHSGFAELTGITSGETKLLTATTTPIEVPHHTPGPEGEGSFSIVRKGGIPQTDPVLGHLHVGEQMALQSLALRHYGLPLQKLPPEAQKAILTRRIELIKEAANELPVHVPELNYNEAANELDEFIKTASPDTQQALAWLKSKGIDTAKVVSDNQINDIAEQTGIKSARSVTKKASRIKERSASLSPKDFNKVREDTVAYFKNPSKGRLAADGTRVGLRDKRAWNERLKSDNFNDFISDLKEADGNHIQFENPTHRLLFHYANRDKLPAPVRTKLLRMLKYKLPNQTAEDFGKAADRLLVHLHQLATTGRLTSESNVFKSSNYAGAPTKWQFDLNTEVDKQELALLAKTIEMHPNGLKAMRGIVQIFQANRRMSLANNPEQWLIYNRVLDNLLTGQVK